MGGRGASQGTTNPRLGCDFGSGKYPTENIPRVNGSVREKA
jgi:hypothetical protein